MHPVAPQWCPYTSLLRHWWSAPVGWPVVVWLSPGSSGCALPWPQLGNETGSKTWTHAVSMISLGLTSASFILNSYHMAFTNIFITYIPNCVPRSSCLVLCGGSKSAYQQLPGCHLPCLLMVASSLDWMPFTTVSIFSWLASSASFLSSFLVIISVSGCSNIWPISTVQPSYFWHQLSHDSMHGFRLEIRFIRHWIILFMNDYNIL